MKKLKEKLKNQLPSPSDGVAILSITVTYGIAGWEFAQPGLLKLLAIPLVLMGVANIVLWSRNYNFRIKMRDQALEAALQVNDSQMDHHMQEMAELRNALYEAKQRRPLCPGCGTHFNCSTEYDDYLCESCRKLLTEDE
jgi:hypothetical protein